MRRTKKGVSSDRTDDVRTRLATVCGWVGRATVRCATGDAAERMRHVGFCIISSSSVAHRCRGSSSLRTPCLLRRRAAGIASATRDRRAHTQGVVRYLGTSSARHRMAFCTCVRETKHPIIFPAETTVRRRCRAVCVHCHYVMRALRRRRKCKWAARVHMHTRSAAGRSSSSSSASSHPFGGNRTIFINIYIYK